MGEEGATWVRDRFSQERLADDLTSLYGELLARARANGSDGYVKQLAQASS